MNENDNQINDNQIENILKENTNFKSDTLKYDKNTVDDTSEKIIVTRVDNQLYYYLYNLPNHFGIRINEQNAICYSKQGEGQDSRFSVGDLIYRDGNNFIITKDPTTSGYYFTIDPVNRR